MIHALLWLVLLVGSAAKVAAQARPDSSGVDHFWSIADRLAADSEPAPEAWHRQLDTPAYRQRHRDTEAKFTGTRALTRASMARVDSREFRFYAPAQELSFSTKDSAVIHADLYGTGPRGVVLAHGGQFNKESWREQGRVLAAAGYRVVAIDFRGHGRSRALKRARTTEEDNRHLDVIAAIEYLRNTGATSVSVVGASMGGDYAAKAAEQNPDWIDRLVLLAAGAYTPLISSKARKLFIMSRDDIIGDNTPRMPAIRRQYDKASGPKEFIVLDGSAHAQALFVTSQGARLTQEILRFLSSP